MQTLISSIITSVGMGDGREEDGKIESDGYDEREKFRRARRKRFREN